MLKIRPKCCLKQNLTPALNTYSRTRYLSGTLTVEPDTCLEHLQQSQTPVWNTVWALITLILIIALDIQFWGSPPPSPCNHPLPSEFWPFFTWTPLAPSTGCHKCMLPNLQTFAVILTSHWIFKTFYWQILRNFSEMGSQQYIIVF